MEGCVCYAVNFFRSVQKQYMRIKINKHETRYAKHNGGETGLIGSSKDMYAVLGEIPPLSVQI